MIVLIVEIVHFKGIRVVVKCGAGEEEEGGPYATPTAAPFAAVYCSIGVVSLP